MASRRWHPHTRREHPGADVCRRKVRFRDKREATKALHAIQRTGERRDRLPERVYHCPCCNGYHLTSQAA